MPATGPSIIRTGSLVCELGLPVFLVAALGLPGGDLLSCIGHSLVLVAEFGETLVAVSDPAPECEKAFAEDGSVWVRLKRICEQG